MGYRGFYKRRRGILEHLEAGRISLLDSAIHDYLCLKANSIVGNGDYAPPGVWIGSAKAIHATCPRQVTERAVQRSLDHLEQLGWIKRFRTPGAHGNYPIIIARLSVIELTPNGRKEYRVDADATRDWEHPVLVPVNPVTEQVDSGEIADKLLTPNKELRSKKCLPAKKRQADPRHKPTRDHYQKRSQEITGAKAQWDGADGEALNRWLRRESDKSEGFLNSWLDNAFNSTDAYAPLRPGFRFTEFERHCAKYAKGPLRKGEVASRNQKPLDQQFEEVERRRAGQGVN